MIKIIKTGLKNKYTTKLAMINEATSEIIKNYRPHHVAIESVFFSVNAGTAIKAIVAAIIPNRLVLFNIKTPYSLFL